MVSVPLNVRYCWANDIFRKSSRLEHFTNEAVTDPTVGALSARIETRLDPALMEGKFENASRATVAVHLEDGRVLRCASTGTSGLWSLSKSEDQHLPDFYAHTGYGSTAIDLAAARHMIELTSRLATQPEGTSLLPLNLSKI